MSETHFSGPIVTTGDANNAAVFPPQVSGALFLGGEPQAAGVNALLPLATVTAIAQATGTRVGRITVPNLSGRLTALILVSSAPTAASHVYDSVRSDLYILAVQRNAGNVAVGTLTSLSSIIATGGVAAAYTLTSTIALAAVAGGATATNTFDIQVTNTVSTSAISETQITVLMVNGAANGAYITA